VSRLRYQARRVRDQDGGTLGWGVFPEPRGTPRMAAGFTGLFAWWRAHWHAATLNHALEPRGRR
jgi:hypothetical protein